MSLMEDNHMQRRLVEEPPSYAQSYDPQSLKLPSVPDTQIPHSRHDQTLPSLASTIPASAFRPPVKEARYQATPWPSTNPLAAYYQPTMSSPRTSNAAASPATMEFDVASPDSRGRRAGSVLSMDDPDVRLAAEALGDLRAADVRSPSHQHSCLPSLSATPIENGHTNGQQPEPLLSLITTSHPLLGSAIGGSLSAYSASKNYSPRFKSSAEYVERRFSPVVNTVGSVGRVTGVEGGVRWFLGARKPSDHEVGDEGSSKRRKVEDAVIDVDRNISHDPYPVHRQDFQHRERSASQISGTESLPAYDDHRSPSYEAQALVPTQQEPSTTPGTWQSRLIRTTSGLSVAMSDESLRSLKYCLGWLRWANQHIGKVINALKAVLEQYDESMHPKAAVTNGDERAVSNQLVVRDDKAADRTILNTRIAALKSDVLKTLRDVVDVVSKYAGGALPENARILVRRHLTSLPQRFRVASTPTNGHARGSASDGDIEVRESAGRILVLAMEGLDMMAQVSGVLDGTIVSAEEWCERLGRKKGDVEAAGDVTPTLPSLPADTTAMGLVVDDDAAMT